MLLALPFFLVVLGAYFFVAKFGEDGPPPPRLDLVEELPARVFEPSFSVEGQTSHEVVVATIDGHRATVSVADDRFKVPIELAGFGYHRIELAASDDGKTPSERQVEYIIRAEPTPAAPVVLAVREAEEAGTFLVVLKVSPGADPIVVGGDYRVIPTIYNHPTDRREVLVTPTSGGRVTFSAKGEEEGDPSGPIDLAAAAGGPPLRPDADRTQSDITYTIDSGQITRDRTVELASDRPELFELLEGRTSVRDFLDEVAGVPGMRLRGRIEDCDEASAPLVESATIDLGERAKVTLHEAFPGLLTRLNSFTDRPELRLCFEGGFPKLGNEGSLTVDVMTASLEIVGREPGRATSGTKDAGDTAGQRRLGWTSVAADQDVVVHMARQPGWFLVLFPGLAVGDLTPDPTQRAVLSNMWFAIVQSLGLVLLLWTVTSPYSRRHFPVKARTAIANVLTLTVSVALLPLVGILFAVYGDPVLDLAVNNPSTAALLSVGAVIGLVLALAALRQAVRAKRMPELFARVIAAVILSVLLISLMVGVGYGSLTVLAILGMDGAQAERGVLIALIALTAMILMTYGRYEFEHFRPSIGWNGLFRATLWVVGLGLLASIPFGMTDFNRTDTVVAQWIHLIPFLLSASVMLLSANALLAVFAFVPFIVVALGRKSWERLVLEARDVEHRKEPGYVASIPLAGRDAGLELAVLRVGLVIYAGYVIGTAGVFASIPIPFVLALLLFGRLLISRREAVRLANIAKALRTQRRHLLEERLRSDAAPAAPTADFDSPKALVAAVGPYKTIGLDVFFAVKTGAALLLPFVVVYLTQYDYATLTRYDAWYLQRFALNVVSTVGSWLVVSFFFGLTFEYLRGRTGLAKGFRLGIFTLLLTVPFLMLGIPSGQTTPVGITLRILQVLGFTALLGAAFDVHLLKRAGLLQWGSPRQLLHDLGALSGAPQLAAGVTVVTTAVGATLVTIVNGQVTEIVTRAISPFLPLPTN